MTNEMVVYRGLHYHKPWYLMNTVVCKSKIYLLRSCGRRFRLIKSSLNLPARALEAPEPIGFDKDGRPTHFLTMINRCER